MIEGLPNIINAFNEHFVNVSKNLNKVKYKPENFDKLRKFLVEKLKFSVFNFDLITPFEVKTIIDKLDVNKSTGLDGIGPRIIKLCRDMLTLPIASLINKCLNLRVFPDKLKEAFVLPISKNSNIDDVNNYTYLNTSDNIKNI